MKTALPVQILPRRGAERQECDRIGALHLDEIFPIGGVSVITPDSDTTSLPTWNRQLLSLIHNRDPDKPVEATVLVNAETNFPENVERVRLLMEQGDLQLVRLVFNQWEFLIDRTTPLEEYNKSFIANMIGKDAGIQRIFNTDSLLGSNDPDHVNFVGRVIAYANLVNESIIITGPTYDNLYIDPGDTLDNGVSGLRREPHKQERAKPKSAEPQEAPVKRNYDVEITDFVKPKMGNQFELVVRTSLSKDDLHTELCNKFFPAQYEHIQEIEGGFKIFYPESVGDDAYKYLGTIVLAQHMGKEDPAAYSMKFWDFDKKFQEEIKRARMLEKINHYYKLIDRGDLDRVLAMFSEDAVYERCEDIYRGRKAIEEFYRMVREGVVIRHIVRPEDITMSEKKDKVCVSAHFTSNKIVDGLPRTFQDTWTFGKDGLLVTFRVSTLGLGGAAVRNQ